MENFSITTNELTLAMMLVGSIGLSFFLMFVRQILFSSDTESTDNLTTVSGRLVTKLKDLADLNMEMDNFQFDTVNSNNYVYTYNGVSHIYSTPISMKAMPEISIAVDEHGHVPKVEDGSKRTMTCAFWSVAIGAITIVVEFLIYGVGSGFVR